MPAVISKVGQILTAPENASVVGAVPAATDLIGNAAWTTAAAALMPDVLPAAGTLLSAGGARQLQAGSTVTHAGHFLFSPDNTYDIGANAATRPRTIYVGTSVLAPLFNNPAAAATTLGNSTYGVTVPGAATFSGDISMQKATQGYIRAYGTGGVNNIAMYDDNTNGILSTSSGNLNLVPTGGTVAVTGAVTTTATVTANSFSVSNLTTPYTSVNHWNTTYLDRVVFGFGLVREADIQTHRNSGGIYGTDHRVYGTSSTYDSGGTKYIRNAHDGTNGILSTSSGNLNLVPTGGTVAVTGAVTASGVIYSSAGYTFPPNVWLNSAGPQTRMYFVTSGASIWACGTNSGTLHEFRGSSGSAIASITASGFNVTGGITASGVVSHGAYTVATLPAAGSNAGKMAQVTDSNVAASGNYGATVAAGGANRVKVFSDGTNWVIA